MQAVGSGHHLIHRGCTSVRAEVRRAEKGRIVKTEVPATCGGYQLKQTREFVSEGLNASLELAHLHLQARLAGDMRFGEWEVGHSSEQEQTVKESCR